MISKGRILGLDYGSKTVGAAVCDPFHVTVTELMIIRRENENHLRKTLRTIASLTEEYNVSLIVLGYPLNMDGSEGARTEKTLEFKKLLEGRISVPVQLQDERLTTVEAEEIMRDRGIRREEYEKYVDMVAAGVILRDYLNSEKDTAGPEGSDSIANGYN